MGLALLGVLVPWWLYTFFATKTLRHGGLYGLSTSWCPGALVAIHFFCHQDTKTRRALCSLHFLYAWHLCVFTLFFPPSKDDSVIFILSVFPVLSKVLGYSSR